MAATVHHAPRSVACPLCSRHSSATRARHRHVCGAIPPNARGCLSICAGSTCKKQGANEVVAFGESLLLEDIHIEACGCLGLCGNGPNAVLELHGQKPVKLSHITTTTGLARVLEQFCDVRVDERTLKASQLRSAGNAEARRGNAKRAVNFYRDALAADPPQGRHLILSNLSVVLLTVKDLDSALEAAREAQACAPPGWPRGYMREADVLCAMGRKDEAAAALEGARRADRGAHRSLEYQAIARQLGLDKRAR